MGNPTSYNVIVNNNYSEFDVWRGDERDVLPSVSVIRRCYFFLLIILPSLSLLSISCVGNDLNNIMNFTLYYVQFLY